MYACTAKCLRVRQFRPLNVLRFCLLFLSPACSSASVFSLCGDAVSETHWTSCLVLALSPVSPGERVFFFSTASPLSPVVLNDSTPMRVNASYYALFLPSSRPACSPSLATPFCLFPSSNLPRKLVDLPAPSFSFFLFADFSSSSSCTSARLFSTPLLLSMLFSEAHSPPRFSTHHKAPYSSGRSSGLPGCCSSCLSRGQSPLAIRPLVRFLSFCWFSSSRDCFALLKNKNGTIPLFTPLPLPSPRLVAGYSRPTPTLRRKGQPHQLARRSLSSSPSFCLPRQPSSFLSPSSTSPSSTFSTSFSSLSSPPQAVPFLHPSTSAGAKSSRSFTSPGTPPFIRLHSRPLLSPALLSRTDMSSHQYAYGGRGPGGGGGGTHSLHHYPSAPSSSSPPVHGYDPGKGIHSSYPPPASPHQPMHHQPPVGPVGADGSLPLYSPPPPYNHHYHAAAPPSNAVPYSSAGMLDPQRPTYYPSARPSSESRGPPPLINHNNGHHYPPPSSPAPPSFPSPVPVSPAPYPACSPCNLNSSGSSAPSSSSSSLPSQPPPFRSPPPQHQNHHNRRVTSTSSRSMSSTSSSSSTSVSSGRGNIQPSRPGSGAGGGEVFPGGGSSQSTDALSASIFGSLGNPQFNQHILDEENLLPFYGIRQAVSGRLQHSHTGTLRREEVLLASCCRKCLAWYTVVSLRLWLSKYLPPFFTFFSESPCRARQSVSSLTVQGASDAFYSFSCRLVSCGFLLVITEVRLVFHARAFFIFCFLGQSAL